MTDYPYVYNAGNLKNFLQQITDLGTPTKVTQEYLESLGFKSKNDRAIVSVLKFIDLLADDGSPGEDYMLLRDRTQFGAVLASHIRKGYGELFSQYPDADKKSTETLRNFFATKQPNLGASALSLIVTTFKGVCELADFGAPTPISSTPSIITPGGTTTQPAVVTPQALGGNVTVNLNIQLQLPTTENASIYENIFKSLREHIIERKPSTGA